MSPASQPRFKVVRFDSLEPGRVVRFDSLEPGRRLSGAGMVAILCLDAHDEREAIIASPSQAEWIAGVLQQAKVGAFTRRPTFDGEVWLDIDILEDGSALLSESRPVRLEVQLPRTIADELVRAARDARGAVQEAKDGA